MNITRSKWCLVIVYVNSKKYIIIQREIYIPPYRYILADVSSRGHSKTSINISSETDEILRPKKMV